MQRPARDCLREIKTKILVDLTIGRAITLLRRRQVDEHLSYIYVVDAEDVLLGVVRVRDLLLKNPHSPIRDIMESRVITVHEEDSLHNALALMENHHLLAIPVIDDQSRLLGIIDIRDYFEEAVDIDSSKKRWQIFQTLGFLLLEEGGMKPSPWKNYLARMPWIFCNMVGGFLCAAISNIYEDVYAKVLLLAMFTPLVLALSESISMQAMTQSIVDIGKHLNLWHQWVKNLFQELKLFLLLATSSGLIVGSVSLLWGDGLAPAAIIAISIMISVTITALIGILIPVLIHRWRLDPKIASGPIVLMLADVLTITIYLTLGFWLLL